MTSLDLKQFSILGLGEPWKFLHKKTPNSSRPLHSGSEAYWQETPFSGLPFSMFLLRGQLKTTALELTQTGNSFSSENPIKQPEPLLLMPRCIISPVANQPVFQDMCFVHSASISWSASYVSDLFLLTDRASHRGTAKTLRPVRIPLHTSIMRPKNESRSPPQWLKQYIYDTYCC